MCDVTFYESTTLIYGVNVFCPGCTTIRVALCSDRQRCCVWRLTGSQVHATSQSSSLCTDRHHICCRSTVCSVSVFSANTLDTTSVIQHDDFIHVKVFSWIVHFTKFVAQSVKNLSYFPKSIIVWVFMARRFVIVFKMEES